MDATLQVEKRETRGKNEARRLRAAGRIPAVVYGAEKGKAVEISVDPKILSRILHSDSGANTLISLQGLEGAADARVLVKEYQLDPIHHKMLHADFYQVAMDKMLTVTVPIVLKGEARGVKQQGGVVDFVNREIEIEVLPGDIPETIQHDVSSLEMGATVTVAVWPAAWKNSPPPRIMPIRYAPTWMPFARPRSRVSRMRTASPSVATS